MSSQGPAGMGFLPPQVVAADVHRRAVRGCVLGADGRILLERVHLPTDPGQGTWWEQPGGGREPGETSEAALLREIAEETGLSGLRIGPPIATRRIRYRGRTGEIVEQHETFHLVDASTASVGRAAPEAGEGETITDLRWFSADELRSLRRLDPAEIARMATSAAAPSGAWFPQRLPDVDCVQWSDERDGVPLVPSTATARIVDAEGRPATAASLPDPPARVVRDAAPWTPTVHAFLDHLADRGFDGAPTPLGIDAYGREAVTYVPGLSAGRLGSGDGDGHAGSSARAVSWPEPLRTLDGMAAVGGLLRRLREAAVDFEAPPRATWITDATGTSGMPAGRGGSASIVHGDVGWANLVWRPDGAPALIDWEFAQPGEPLRDVAQAACWLVPLVPFDHEARGFSSEPDRPARLAALARGAGVEVDEVIDAARRYVAAETERIRVRGEWGVEPWASLLRRGALDRFAELADGLESGRSAG